CPLPRDLRRVTEHRASLSPTTHTFSTFPVPVRQSCRARSLPFHQLRCSHSQPVIAIEMVSHRPPSRGPIHKASGTRSVRSAAPAAALSSLAEAPATYNRKTVQETTRSVVSLSWRALLLREL